MESTSMSNFIGDSRLSMNPLTQIVEQDESDLSEESDTDRDEEREDEESTATPTPVGRSKPSMSAATSKKYTHNWDYLLNIGNNLDDDSHITKDLPGPSATENIDLNGDKSSSGSNNEQKEENGSAGEVETKGNEQEVKVKKRTPPMPKKRTNITSYFIRTNEETTREDADKQNVTSDSQEENDNEVPERTSAMKSQIIYSGKSAGSPTSLFRKNPTLEGHSSWSASSFSRLIYANAAFEEEDNKETTAMEVRRRSGDELEGTDWEMESRQREEEPSESGPSRVHWHEDIKDKSDEEKPKEISDLDMLSWDVFRSYRYDTNAYACEKFALIGSKVLKVIFVLVSFVTILAALTVSKLSLLFATSNINKDVGFRVTNDTCGAPVKFELPGCKKRDVVRWLWCIMLCVCTSYVLTLLVSLWKICFKKKPKPKWSALFFVLLIESLHTIGLMMLLLIILPTMDIIEGIFLMNAIGLLPSFFKLFVRPPREKKSINIILDIVAFVTQVAPLVIYLVLEIVSNKVSSNCFSKTSNETDMSCMNETSITTVFTVCSWEEPTKNNARYLIPLALLLISCTWWQNFVDKNLKMVCVRRMVQLSRHVKRGRTKIFALVSLWKMALSFACLLLVARFHILENDEYGTDFMRLLFGMDESSFNSSAFRDHNYTDNMHLDFEDDWLLVYAASSVAGFICYIVSLNAIQAKVQKSTYSLAIALATPTTILIAKFWFCSVKPENIKPFQETDPYWNCLGGSDDEWVLLGLIWWCGQLIVTRYLWSPKSERLAKSSRIFVKPFYCGALLEQSLALNRSRHDKYKEKRRKLPRFKDDITPDEISIHRAATIRHNITADRQLTQEEIHDDDDDADQMVLTMTEDILYDRPDKTEPMIFICATMWHENEQEMVQMLKSILRLDRDQCVRRLTREYFHVSVPDFYNFEAHIFFDDAFNKYIPGDPEYTVNRFVAQFVKIINEAATYVHSANIQIEPAKKIPTPYGGRLMFMMPGGNLLYVHLKDKQKIRHRKRWSQVMYMYYLLGHRLWDKPIKRRIKEQVAYNTYILTLDGDVDFKPEAVILLIDLMRRNFGVGAACGRIHPEGSGPMVWYQKFEYAISHWLQKTTEHVLGCVLCSPGCFSLFRASALMDDNVMKTYSKQAEEALHYVQYDQGEDRWLCTLLLQRGYRVEYSAAADALTYAPEGFNEFFNQRRRWTPSTFANILDLLASGRATAKRNQNISMLYIIYQGGLMFSSVVGPATIFLMVVSAFGFVFGSLNYTGSFFLVLIPVAIFFILCMFTSQGTQLGFAAVLAGLFALSQMVVLVGLIIGIAEDGLCSPTSWFLLGTSGIFILAGIFHPQELMVLIHGLLYFLLIPTMYLLLIIYSLCNLHVVSWGTREVVQTTAEKEKLKQREMELAAQQASTASKDSGILAKFTSLVGSNAKAAEGSNGWTLACGDCCRCLCCPRPGESYTDEKISKLQKQVSMLPADILRLFKQNKIIGNDEENVPLMSKEDTSANEQDDSDDGCQPIRERLTETKDHGSTESASIKQKIDEDDCSDTKSQSDSEYKDNDTEEIKSTTEYSEARPYWAQDVNSLGRGPIGSLSEKEEEFWIHLIRRYLLPIDKNPEREERIKKDLLALRNKAIIAFFMIDLLFIVLFMSLQEASPVPEEDKETNSTVLYLEYYCDDPVTGEVKRFFIEPIGFAFLLVFGSFLVIQFIGMLFHRLFSLIQVVSSTVICQKKKSDQPTNYMDITRMLAEMNEDGNQSPDTMSLCSMADTIDTMEPEEGFDSEFNETDVESDSPPATKRYNNVIKRLQTEQKVYRTMDKVFAQRFVALNERIKNASLREPDMPLGVTNDPEDDSPKPSNYVRRRLSSIFMKPANFLPNRPGDRKMSVDNPLIYDLRRKQTEIYTPEKEMEIRQRFQLSDKDIKKEERKVTKLIPEVRNINSSSAPSNGADIENQ